MLKTFVMVSEAKLEDQFLWCNKAFKDFFFLVLSLLRWFDYFGLVDACYFCLLQQVIHKMIVSDILID